MDIKNILEVLNAAKVAGDVAVEAFADGKLNLLDLPKMVKVFGPLKSAIEGVANIPAEIKDVDSEELAQIVNAFTDVAAAWLPLLSAKVA